MARKNKSKSKDKEKGKSKSSSSSKSKSSKTSIYDPASTLKGSDIRKLAKKLTAVSYNPQISAAKSQKKSLRGLLKSATKSSDALTRQASGDVDSYYRSLDASDEKNKVYQEQLAARLRGDVAGAGYQTQAVIASAGDAASGRLEQEGELRRLGSTSAQDELAFMQAAQRANASREATALSSQASNQSAQMGNMQAQQAKAAQSRGGAYLTDINRQGQANQAELQGIYGPDIIEAGRAVRQLKGDRAGARAQMVRQLIGEEREYGLSKAAVGLDKAGLEADMAQAKLSAQTSKANAKRTAATSRANSIRTAATSRANTAANNRADAIENAKDRRADTKQARREKRQEYRADVETARGKANTYVHSYREDHKGNPPTDSQVYNYLLGSYGEKVARNVVYGKGNTKAIAGAVDTAATVANAVDQITGGKKRKSRRGMNRP